MNVCRRRRRHRLSVYAAELGEFLYVRFIFSFFSFLRARTLTQTHTHTHTYMCVVSRCRVYKDCLLAFACRSTHTHKPVSTILFTHLIRRYYCHKTNIFIYTFIFTIFSAFLFCLLVLLFSKIFHWSFCLAASNYLFICFHADIRVTKHEQRPLLSAARSLKFRESESHSERERRPCQAVCSSKALLFNSFSKC